MIRTDTLVVGASFSGLACAAALRKKNISFLVIEKQDRVAAPWHHHYKRLHLHTNKRISHLPFRTFDRHIPRYPSREEVIEYLEQYQKEFDIRPVFNSEALKITRQDNQWITETVDDSYCSDALIMATGAFNKPRPVQIEGMESFPGVILHSAGYASGQNFRNQNVLVIGFGNSACEIAIDLFEQGATVSMSVRSAVNVIPRDIFGIPVLELSLLLSPLQPRLADAITAPLIRGLTGDLEKLGLKKMAYGPMEEIRKDGKVPVLDIGTLKHIRQGHIRVAGGIARIENRMIFFCDGQSEEFDAVIAAIGYDNDYGSLLDVDPARFDDLRFPLAKQRYFGKNGLYFCGHWISPTGQIREIARDALAIAKDIARTRPGAPEKRLN